MELLHLCIAFNGAASLGTFGPNPYLYMCNATVMQLAQFEIGQGRISHDNQSR
jgi:hypothetical protein